MAYFAQQLSCLFLCGFWSTITATPENCYKEIYGYSGYIISPNYPEPFPSGRNCTWIISTFSFYKIHLTFLAFDLEYHESCENDYLIVYDGSRTEDKVLGKLCGSSVPQPLVSSKNVMRITFYSDSRDQGRGFNVTYDSAMCGSNFVQSEGHFMSPTYPDNYSGFKRCFWSIETSHDLQVSLNLNSVQLSNSSDCSTEFIKIFSLASDEVSRQLDVGPSAAIPLAHICNGAGVMEHKTAISDLRSVSNKMFVIYESSSCVQNLHFKATFSTMPCGGVYKQDDGIIGVSYPENHGRNIECSWIIEVSEGHQVVLHSTALNIPESLNCTTDFLEIREDLNDSSSLLLDRVCGIESPKLIASTTNIMWIRLKSGASTSAREFIAKFSKATDKCETGEHLCEQNCQNTLSGYDCSCEDGYILNNDSYTCSDEDECATAKHACEQTCINEIGGYACLCENGYTLNNDNHTCSANCFHHLTNTTGMVTSSNFPQSYPSNEICIWKFSTIPGFRIKLVFLDFKVEYDKDCQHDSLSVYDGDDISAAPLLRRFCGYETPPNIVSTGSNMLMTFQSDSNIQWKGFRAEYFAASCLYSTSSAGGIIHSSNYPNTYPSMEGCLWVISTMPGHTLKLEFVDFELEYHKNCKYDFVSLYDGYNIATAPLLGRFCGIEIPPFKMSSANHMVLAFRSDSSVQWRGFKARYVSVCGGNMTATSSAQYIYSHSPFNNKYGSWKDCDWLLSTSGHRLRLHFEIFQLESHNTCSYDYVEIFEGFHPTGHRIAKLCGYTIPEDVVSNGPEVLLRFHTDGRQNFAGFALTFSEEP